MEQEDLTLSRSKGAAALLTVEALARPPMLQPVGFTLAAGECLILRGASGAGKTTLLRALADLDPCRGAVALDGVPCADIPGPAWRRQVVYVPAEPGWWAETVREHFAGWGEGQALAASLGLPADCGDWPVARLSTGERQRLALARGLEMRPRVLLLDEPTSGLDTDAAAAVEVAARERLAGGAAALWVTHDRAQARRLAERALELRDGRISEVRP